MAEQEQDRLLDHNYDGIQEYDNPMPRWWVWIFAVTIVFSVFYAIYFHGKEGRSIQDAYNADMLAYFEEQAKQLLAMGPITEKTLLDIQNDPSKMAGAAQMFATRCVSCHGPGGGGNIGPNLTDDYWLHGGRLVDIYKTVNEGVPDKGMLAWGKQLGVGDVLSVAAYVGTLRGSHPPHPKAPQGEHYVYDRDAVLAAEAAKPAGPS